MSGPKKAKYESFTPPDLQGLRGGGIDFLSSILRGQTGPGSQFGSLFGNMGTPTTDLQRQSLGGISQYLNQQAPEQRALESAMPFFGNLLGTNPGQGMLDALKPRFEQNLAQANQQGGRFGSGNAILRSRAVDDYNLLGAQALQQGVNQQLQGTQALALLSGQAGQNPFQRLMGGYGVGQQQAQQMDNETIRRLQLLQGFLGMGLQSGLQSPVVQTQQASGGLGGFLGGLGGMLGGSFLGPIGAAAGGAVGKKLFG